MIPNMLRKTLGFATDASAGPGWVILDIHGAYPAGGTAGGIPGVIGGDTLPALTERIERLARTGWVRAVLVRVGELLSGPATAHAIGRALGRLAADKRVVGYTPHVDMRSLLVTAELAERVAPESAEVLLPGFALEQVYFGDFLRRHGVGFENLRIREYKAALTPFSQDAMDEYNREQLSAYVASAERAWLAAVPGAASVLDRNPTSARELLELGVLTKVAYDDEIVTVEPDWRKALTLALPRVTRATGKKADGIALVPVHGPIVSGRSRPQLPLPFTGGHTAGSDTVVAALRRAGRDEQVKAVVLHVDSGGGSALASDVIDRAVQRCGKPVVAVMGETAASGGYYVLAHADHVVAAPYTVTGSIGVVMGKPVLAEFDARHGLNPQVVGRETALFASPHRPFSAEDRAWAERMMTEAYYRFVGRVASGRRLDRDRVEEIARGRIWSGADALQLGLVDELGDLHSGIAAARALAGLPDDAPVRHLAGPPQLPALPAVGRAPAEAVRQLWPFGSEMVLTWLDRPVRLR